jgi:hypothetical protein
MKLNTLPFAGTVNLHRLRIYPANAEEVERLKTVAGALAEQLPDNYEIELQNGWGKNKKGKETYDIEITGCTSSDKPVTRLNLERQTVGRIIDFMNTIGSGLVLFTKKS